MYAFSSLRKKAWSRRDIFGATLGTLEHARGNSRNRIPRPKPCENHGGKLRSGQSTVGGPKWTKIDTFRPKWTILVHFGLANTKNPVRNKVILTKMAVLTILGHFGPVHFPTVLRWAEPKVTDLRSRTPICGFLRIDISEGQLALACQCPFPRGPNDQKNLIPIEIFDLDRNF